MRRWAERSLPVPDFISGAQAMDVIKAARLHKNGKKRLEAAMVVMCSFVWRDRNNNIFRGDRFESTKV
ncbi:hypothetical protein OROGR_023892 [Orobanche gracilis]